MKKLHNVIALTSDLFFDDFIFDIVQEPFWVKYKNGSCTMKNRNKKQPLNKKQRQKKRKEQKLGRKNSRKGL